MSIETEKSVTAPIFRYLHKNPLAVTLGIAVAIGCGQSHASTLEEVIVTAQKRSENANEVGMAIQSISGNTLIEEGITDTADLAALVPGLTFTPTFTGTPVYTLRGVGFDDFSVQATSTVGVYLDEISIPYPAMTRGIALDIERVEVLKGPQGTLYGRNSTGGAINYIANKPGDTFEASVTAGYASFEEFSVRGFVSTPLSDQAGLRIAATTTQSNKGWQQSLTSGERLGELDRTAVRAILDLNPADTLQLTLAVDWWQDKSEPQAPVSLGFQFADPSNLPVAQAIAGNTILGSGKDNQEADWTQNNSLYQFYSDVSNVSVSATVKWDVSDRVQLTSLTNYAKYKDDNSLRPTDGLPGVPTAATGNPPFPSLVPGSDGNQANYNNYLFSDIEVLSQELRLAGGTGVFNWITGIYLAADEITGNTVGRFDFTTNTDFAPEVQFDNLENRSYTDGNVKAIFAHTDWQFTDRMQLTAGLRYSEYEKDFEGCTADPGTGDIGAFFGAAPGECVSANDIDGTFETGLAKFKLDENSVSGRLGLDYSLSDDHLLYAAFSRGFKDGGFPTTDATFQSQFAPVLQEQVDAFELGFKSTLAGGAAQLNASAFYYDYKDKQMVGFISTAFGVLGRLINAPESEVTGIEFDLQWQLSDSWYANIGATHIKSEVTRFAGIDNVGDPQDFAGFEFPNSPDTTASATINYETNMGGSLRAGFGLNVTYQSDMKTAFSEDPRFVIDSYTVFNARAFIESGDGRWRTNFWVRNLADEDYFTSIRNGIDTVIAWSGQPRRVGVDLTYNWK